MRYRLFGQTGLRVSEILLGTMAFDDEDELRRVVDAYADAGGNVLDTASSYGEGEALLGKILDRRDRFVLSTKYTMTRDQADPNAAGNHRKNLTASLERGLRRLNTDYVDIYWAHIWDRHTPLEETMRALDDAVRAGKILYVGISDAPAWVVAHANTLARWRGWTPFAGLQVPYNLLQRDAERELLPMAEAFGMSVTAWAPLAQGKLSGSSSPRRFDPAELTDRERAVGQAVRKVAGELGVSPAQVALAWTRARSDVVLPLVGVRDVAQLEDNLGALDLVLPSTSVEELEAATEFTPGFPSDFIAMCEPHPGVFGEAATRVVPRVSREC